MALILPHMPLGLRGYVETGHRDLIPGSVSFGSLRAMSEHLAIAF